MKIRFDTRGNERQKECAKAWLNDEITDILYGGAKGGAKTYTGCSLIFGDAFIYPQTHYFISRKTLNDLRKFTIPSIFEVFEHWGIDSDMYKFNGSDNIFTLYNQSKVFLLDAKYIPSDPLFQRFGSMQMTRGWIEEGGEFEYDSYANLKISIGRWKNDVYDLKRKLLITANPSKNFLYKQFYSMHKNGTLEPWKCYIQAFLDDNKTMSDGYKENLYQTLTGSERDRLLGGNWEYDDDPNALCDYDKIIDLFRNDHILKTDQMYITADIARFGSDKAVVGVWNGWELMEVYTFDKSSTTEIQALINHLRVVHSIPKSNCIADEDGVGGGIVDNCGIEGFVNNSRPLTENGEQPQYKNLQVQCIYHLAKKINTNQIYISADLQEKQKDEIIEELEQIKSKNKEGLKLDVISKAEIKQNIGRSPDYRDMMFMRVWFDLKPKAPNFSMTTRNSDQVIKRRK